MSIEVPNKIIKVWKTDFKNNLKLDTSEKEIQKAFLMLYLYKGKAYIDDVFFNGKAWIPRLHPDDRKWLAHYIEHGIVMNEDTYKFPKKNKRKTKK